MKKQNLYTHSNIRNLVIAVAFAIILAGTGCLQVNDAPLPPINDESNDAVVDETTIDEPEITEDTVEDTGETVETTESHDSMPTEDVVSQVQEIFEAPSSLFDSILPEKPTEESASALPNRIDHNVPFQAQAPYGDWDLPWQEACEEASVVMTKYYFNNDLLTKSVMRDEILQLVDWQNENNGDFEDTTVQETADMMLAVFGINSTVTQDVTIERMKQELANGHLILIPASGRGLGNPNFSGTDPFYHMLVVRGYNEKGFITNDPGTRNGAGYVYDYDTFMAAIHDWTGSRETIDSGPKMMAIVKPVR